MPIIKEHFDLFNFKKTYWRVWTILAPFGQHV